MKKVLIIFFILVQSIVCFAQVFNKSYDFWGVSQVAWAIQKDSNQNIIFCSTRDASFVDLGVYVLKVDENGIKTDSSTLFQPMSNLFVGWANSTNPTNDGGFIMGGGIDGGVDYGYLVKFNNLGDTLWTKQHGANGFSIRFAKHGKPKMEAI